MNTKKTKKIKVPDAVQLIDEWFGGDEEWDRLVAEEELKGQVGQIIYDLRTEAGLSQERLAEMVGTSRSVISLLENANYEGSALEMLFRISLALHRPMTVKRTGKRLILSPA